MHKKVPENPGNFVFQVIKVFLKRHCGAARWENPVTENYFMCITGP